jgi:hypothetical protein
MAVASDQTEVNLQTTLCPNPLKLKARTGTLSTSRELAIESCDYAQRKRREDLALAF